MKLRVVYFISTEISDEINGGILCYRNHIKRLSTDSEIELFVVVAAEPSREARSLAYLESHGIAGTFIPFPKSPSYSSFRRKIFYLAKALLNPRKVKKKIFSLFLQEYAPQPHIEQKLIDLIKLKNADIFLVDYFYSTVFCLKAIKTAPKAVLVTHNRECELRKQLKRSHTKSYFKMALVSLHIFCFWLLEKYSFRLMDKIISLSPPDVNKQKGIYITPYLDPKPEQWNPNLSHTIFFVGNISHLPNKEAVHYIIRNLAPALVSLVPDIRFKIIGASAAEVPFHHPSVDLLGKSNATEVERHFLNCQLFICPIKNTFGLKFKIAEALAYGTPFLASHESMLCVPHLKDLPSFSLHRHQQTARTIADIILDKEKTMRLAENIRVRHSEFINSQTNIWSRSLR